MFARRKMARLMALLEKQHAEEEKYWYAYIAAARAEIALNTLPLDEPMPKDPAMPKEKAFTF